MKAVATAVAAIFASPECEGGAGESIVHQSRRPTAAKAAPSSAGTIIRGERFAAMDGEDGETVGAAGLRGRFDMAWKVRRGG
jgi:hypothetical protein